MALPMEDKAAAKKEGTAMKISNEKTYEVTKYTKTETLDYGCLPGSDVKKILRGCKFDEEMELWFTSKCTIGYEVTEID